MSLIKAMSDWPRVFPDPVIAGAVLNRLTHHAHQIQQTGESVRKKLGRAAVNPTLETEADAV